MKILLRIVAVVAAISVAATLWFIATFTAYGGLRPLMMAGWMGVLTIAAWLVALVAGPVAAVGLWRLSETGRRAGILLFASGLAYYVLGTAFWRGPEASVPALAVAAISYALPLVVLLSRRARERCASTGANAATRPR